MANRDDQPFRGLVPDHHGRSGLKDAVSHYLSPPNPLTSTAPQPFPNNLTMPPEVLSLMSDSSRTTRFSVAGGCPRPGSRAAPRRATPTATPAERPPAE